jgi:hypothetical protein
VGAGPSEQQRRLETRVTSSHTLWLTFPFGFLHFHHHAPLAITSAPPPMMTARAHGGMVDEALPALVVVAVAFEYSFEEPKSRGESKGSQYLRSHTRHMRRDSGLGAGSVNARDSPSCGR